MHNRNRLGTFGLIAIIGLFIITVNALFLNTLWRLDLTSDHRYSLSAATLKTLDGLNAPLEIDCYFTDKLPPPYADYRRSISDLLTEYQAASKGKLSFTVIDPVNMETERDREKKRNARLDLFGHTLREPTSIDIKLESLGVKAVEVSTFEADLQQVKRAYMSLVLSYHDKQENISLVDAMANIEWQLTKTIKILQRDSRPLVALVHNSGFSQINNFLKKMGRNIDIHEVDLDRDAEIPFDSDALIMIGKGELNSEFALKSIREFVMQGKKTAFLLDRMEVDPETMQARVGYDEVKENVYALLDEFGLSFSQGLVADEACVSLTGREQEGGQLSDTGVKYPLILDLIKLDQGSSVTRGLHGVAFPFSSAITVHAIEGVKGRALAESSTKSWIEELPIDFNPSRTWTKSTLKMNGPHVVLAELSGSSSSFPLIPKNSLPGAAEARKQVQILASGTSSFLWDDFFSDANIVLSSNIIDWLTADLDQIPTNTASFADPPIDGELSNFQRQAIKYGNALGSPALLMCYGMWRWRRRERRRYNPKT